MFPSVMDLWRGRDWHVRASGEKRNALDFGSSRFSRFRGSVTFSPTALPETAPAKKSPAEAGL